MTRANIFIDCTLQDADMAYTLMAVLQQQIKMKAIVSLSRLSCKDNTSRMLQ